MTIRPVVLTRTMAGPHRGRAVITALLLAILGLAAPLPAFGQETAVESRFWTGCEPGPYSPPRPVEVTLPPPGPTAEQPEVAWLVIDGASVLSERPVLGSGFNFEHALWSCPAFHPVFENALLGPFRPALARVDTGLLPAAPAELSAAELGPDVYQSVLGSEPYAESWAFMRRLNQAGVRIILGVWGGPGQFTHDGDRWGALLPRHYDDYADYVVALVDFIARQQEIDVWAITIANEPNGGDGNRIPPEGLAYIARQLAPRLAPYGVKLYGPDTASAAYAMDYLPLLLDDPVVAESLAFVGFHQYYPSHEVSKLIAYVRARQPDLPVIITEYTSFIYGDLDAGQEAVDHMAFTLDIVNTALDHYARGADAALYWDAVDYAQPGRDALTRWGLLRGPGEDFAPRPWYFAFLQVLPYLGPGSQVLESRQYGGTELNSLTVRTADGHLAVFLVNGGSGEAELLLDVLDWSGADDASLAILRTDEHHEAALLGQLTLSQGGGTLVLPGRSVTSLVSLAPRP